MKAVKLILAFVFAVSMALPVMGQEPTEDVTGAPFEVVPVVTAEATLPVVPGDTDVVVEEGGTVIITPPSETPTQPAPESDVSLIAKLTALTVIILGLLRTGLVALREILERVSKNSLVMTAGESFAPRIPEVVRDQGRAVYEDGVRVAELAKGIVLEWLDNDPYIAKKLAEKPIAPVATADSKPSFPPPSNSEPQG